MNVNKLWLIIIKLVLSCLVTSAPIYGDFGNF